MQIRNQEAVHETRRHSCIWRMMVCHVLQTLFPMLQSSFFLWIAYVYGVYGDIFPIKNAMFWCCCIQLICAMYLPTLYPLGLLPQWDNHSPLRPRKDGCQIADTILKMSKFPLNEVEGGILAGFTLSICLSRRPSVRLQLNPRKQRVSLQLMTSCCMNFAIIIQWIYFTIWKKEKNCHHYNTILSLYNIISRHYKKSLLRSEIYHGYEELSTDPNYLIWRKQERRSTYAVQLASGQLRSNYRKMSVRGQNHVCSVSSTIHAGSISYLHILSSNFRRCVACIYIYFFFFSKLKNLKLWQIP